MLRIDGTKRHGMTPAGAMSRKRERAIASLLSSPTIERAARKCDVSVRTLKRYLCESEFAKEYAAARRSALNAAIGIMARSCASAAITLDSIARSRKQPAAARVSAARSTIALAMKGFDIVDLDERLEKIEKMFNEKMEKPWPSKVA